MKNKFYIVFAILVSILFTGNVKAEIIHGKNTEDYSGYSSVNSSSYNKMFSNFNDDALAAINDYFNDNYGILEDENKYVLVADFGGSYNSTWRDSSVLSLYDSSSNASFAKASSSKVPIGFGSQTCFSFDLTSYAIEPVTCPRTNSYYNALSTYYGFILWTDEDYIWNDLVDDYYNSFLYLSDGLEEKYLQYYDFIFAYEQNEPVYTLMDLVGINTTKISNKTTKYTINYYFDNVLDHSKTEILEGAIGTEIRDFTDYSDTDNYYLVENDYVLTLSANEEDNVLNIYYRSYQWTTYTIEYYFDDIRKDAYTETHKVLTNSFVDEFENYSDDYWTLVEDEYTLTTQEDSSLNILKIYFRSKNYGTEYQTIDTSKSKIPFLFQFTDIKETFTGVNFDIFNQFQQLLITILVNIFFLAFMAFVIHYAIKMVYKVLAWFI